MGFRLPSFAVIEGWIADRANRTEPAQVRVCCDCDTVVTPCNGGVAVKTPVIAIDFETRSGVDLRDVGGRNYALHRTTEVLCVVACLPGGTFIEWRMGEPAPTPLLEAIKSGLPVAAHNAQGFDRHIWRKLGWPEPRLWIDTMHLARAVGLPADLDSIGLALYGIGKDKEGKALTLGLSSYDKMGRLPYVDRPTLDAVLRYCRRDVEILVRVWQDRLCTVYERNDFDAGVRAVSDTVNERGFLLDAGLARNVIDLCEQVAGEKAKAAPVAESVLRSTKQLRNLLAREGIDVKNVKQGTLEELLDDPDLPEHIRLILEARLSSSRSAYKKLHTALSQQGPDGRIRDALVYHGSHTGRWAGRGFQPHNLPKGVKLAEHYQTTVEAAQNNDIAALRGIAAAIGAPIEDVLATLIRSCITAPSGFTTLVADYAGIEARGLAWAAADNEALQHFRGGVDGYRIMAGKLFNKAPDAVTDNQRAIGKLLVLGCGYGMGADTFHAYAETHGVDLAVVGLTAQSCIDAYRDANPLVAGLRSGNYYEGKPCRTGGLWKGVEIAAKNAIQFGGAPIAGRCTWSYVMGDLLCRLPSGRTLTYRAARNEPDTKRGGGKWQITFAHPRIGRVSTYGGKLTENIIQAICRDLLADAMIRCEAAGLPVVLHVHDEIVCEVLAENAEESLRQLTTIMETPPAWASGFPIGVKSFVSQRYRK